MIEERRAFFFGETASSAWLNLPEHLPAPFPCIILAMDWGVVRMQEWNPALSVTRMPVLPSCWSITGILERGGNTAAKKRERSFH